MRKLNTFNCVNLISFMVCCLNLYKSVLSITYHFGRVPGDDPSGNSVILPRHEFYRIVMEAQVKTKEQREVEEAAMKRQKEEMMVSHWSHYKLLICVHML